MIKGKGTPQNDGIPLNVEFRALNAGFRLTWSSAPLEQPERLRRNSIATESVRVSVDALGVERQPCSPEFGSRNSTYKVRGAW